MGSPDYGMDVCHDCRRCRKYHCSAGDMVDFYQTFKTIEKVIRFVLNINPLYHFLRSMRMCILDGISPEPFVYVQCFGIALAMLLIGALIFKIKQDRFVLYL